MRRSQIITIVRSLLGDGAINLEIVDDKHLIPFTNLAIGLASEYATTSQYKSFYVAEGNPIDLSVLGRNPVVVGVYPSEQLLGLGTEYFFANLAVNGRVSLESYANLVLYKSNVEGLLGRSIRQVGDKLYTDRYRGVVTVEYIAEFKYDTDDVDPEVAFDMRAINWVVRYVLMMCYNRLGRIRGKLTVNSQLWSTDAEQLLGAVDYNTLLEELYSLGRVQVSR